MNKYKLLFIISIITTIILFIVATVLFVLFETTDLHTYATISQILIFCGCGLNLISSFLKYKSDKAKKDIDKDDKNSEEHVKT